MPIVQIDYLEGRTLEQRREMSRRITEVICETSNCPPEAVTIIIREISTEHLAKGGKLICDK